MQIMNARGHRFDVQMDPCVYRWLGAVILKLIVAIDRTKPIVNQCNAKMVNTNVVTHKNVYQTIGCATEISIAQ